MISIFKEKLNKTYYVLSAFNLLNIFEQILKMKYNKDYGFPTETSHNSDLSLGFLVDYTPEEVILEIVKKTKFKYYIYIDIKNTKYVIEKDNKTNTTRKYNYTGITYSSQEVFIYYDWFSYCRTN